MKSYLLLLFLFVRVSVGSQDYTFYNVSKVEEDSSRSIAIFDKQGKVTAFFRNYGETAWIYGPQVIKMKKLYGMKGDLDKNFVEENKVYDQRP